MKPFRRSALSLLIIGWLAGSLAVGSGDLRADEGAAQSTPSSGSTVQEIKNDLRETGRAIKKTGSDFKAAVKKAARKTKTSTKKACQDTREAVKQPQVNP